MADDDIARRREIRRRKILEGSEARLRRITSSYSSKITEECIENNSKGEIPDADPIPKFESHCSLDDHRRSTGQQTGKDFNGLLSRGDSFTSNGNFERFSNVVNYTFPKKVSDAETRSFGRTRTDIRRNSSCTQIMMESFQFYAFSLCVLRPWLISFMAVFLRFYVLLGENLPAVQTIYFPLFLLESAFLAWSHLESQMVNKPAENHILASMLMLCGISETVIQRVNHFLTITHILLEDFIIYTFCFVFSHFICETCL